MGNKWIKKCLQTQQINLKQIIYLVRPYQFQSLRLVAVVLLPFFYYFFFKKLGKRLAQSSTFEMPSVNVFNFSYSHESFNKLSSVYSRPTFFIKVNLHKNKV